MEMRFQESAEIETRLGQHSIDGPGARYRIEKRKIIGE
jgi:hypothetical protein